MGVQALLLAAIGVLWHFEHRFTMPMLPCFDNQTALVICILFYRGLPFPQWSPKE